MNTQKPNIILITADQWRGDCLGLLKGRHPVMTPHLNQLAAEGVHFAQAYADCPVCIPQRTTILTGKTAASSRVTNNISSRLPVNSEESLPGLLTRKGSYQTKAIGKMHFVPDRARFGFEHVTLHPNDYVNWLEDKGYGGMYRGHGLGGNEVYPAVSAVPERYSHTHWIIDQSIEFLGQRDPENPFFLWMVFEAPHSPFDPPEPYDRMYDRITIPEPVRGEWMEEENYFLQGKRESYKYDELNEEMVLESRRRYYGQISHIDYQLGRLFGELKTKGLYDNTLILFTSDHGEHLGDFGLFSKQSYLNGSVNVPLIMKLPKGFGKAASGTVINEPVLTADIHATILEAAEVSAEKEMEVESLFDYLNEDKIGKNRIVFGEYGEAGGTSFACDGKYKYIFYGLGGKEQLFDVTGDPENLCNLANRDEVKPIQEALKRELIRYLTYRSSPKVKDNDFVITECAFDRQKYRSQNPCAWRGPLRYGQGY